MNDKQVLCSRATCEHLSSQHLMVDGVLQLAGGAMATAQRGMQFIANDGHVCGMVAALVQNQNGNVTHLLLCQLPVSADYRLVPIDQISTIAAKTVHLTLQAGELDRLIPYQSA